MAVSTLFRNFNGRLKFKINEIVKIINKFN